MSDLIPTPSQTQSSVSNDTFEALIDLLASDGIDENLSENHIQPQANLSLRDPSGKLDFNKIRLMFGSQHAQKFSADEKKRSQCTPNPVLSNDDGDTDDERDSHRSRPSTVPSRSNSMSPQPVQHPTGGHRRSSTFGNQPWTPVHGNITEAKAEDVPLVELPQPLSFDELNTALGSAKEEVKSLRRKCEKLHALVSQYHGAEKRDQTKNSSSVVKTDRITPDDRSGPVETRVKGFQGQPDTSSPTPLPDVPTEIADISENEAKRALSALAHSLNLSVSSIVAMASVTTPTGSTSPQQNLPPTNLTRQHDVPSVVRALKFLRTVDELVWRRASGSSGPRTLLPVFSEENVVALVARLELWERAIRRSSRY